MALPDLTDQFVADSYIGILHTSNVAVSPTNLPQVYDGMGNKTSLKLGSENSGASISGCLSATCLNIGGANFIDYIYPVGSITFSIDNVNPSTRFVGTTWIAEAQGRFIASVGTGTDKNLTPQTLTAGADNLVGEYTHTLSIGEMPSHDHPLTHPDTNEQFYLFNDGNTTTSASNTFRSDGPDQDRDGRYWANIGSKGGGDSHNNIPPYFGLYIWKRTA